MDRFSPVAAAHVRVLVLPVGRIERHIFLDFVRRLQDEAAVIWHKEIKNNVGSGDFLLSPGKSEEGCLLLHFTTSSASAATLQLSPYDIFREPLLVVGVVGGLGEEEEEARRELKAAAEYLRERHPRVVHRHLLVLKDSEDETAKDRDNATVVDQFHERGHPSLVKAIHMLSISFLRELSTYVQAMQASPSIPTPGQTSRSLQRASWMREVETRSTANSGHGTPRNVVSPPPPGEDSASRPPSRSLASPATSFDQIPNTNAAVNALSRSDSNRGAHGREISQDRMAIQGFGTNTSTEKTKRRGKARVGIVVGSVYMMAGMWKQALQMLIEHTTQVKTLQDSLWYAKGLENIIICQLLQAWVGLGFQVPAICQQAIDKSLSKQAAQRFSTDSLAESTSNENSTRRLSTMLPDLVRNIVVLYRSSEGSLELPSLVVCEATIRGSKLLAMLHNCSGALNSDALRRAIEGGNDSLQEPSSSFTNHYKSSSLQGSRLLAKSAIAEVVATALPVHDDTIAVPEQLTLLGGIASVYSILQMERKKAMVIKELVVKLTAALNQARKLGAAEMGIHPAASLSAEHGTDSLTLSMQESGGMLSMISDVANIYGVHLIGTIEKADGEAAEPDQQHSRPRAFGGEALQFSTLRELLALCEASPDPYGILRLIASFLATAGPRAAVDDQAQTSGVAIAQAEQAHLAATISRTIGVSKQLGLTDTQAEYWDPYLLRGVAFSPRSTAAELIDWAKLKGLRPSSSQRNSANPLLYDPNARRLATAERSAVLVQGEAIECILTLQNPYEVGLDIESVKLVTEDGELVTNHGSLHLGPARFQQLLVTVTPSVKGKIVIKGCLIKMVSFREDFFPIVKKSWSEKRSLTVKNIGQEARSGDQDPKQTLPKPEHATVSADVISPLPSLILRDTSLVESSLMLLEGEKQIFETTVENVSNIGATILDVIGNVEGLTMADRSKLVIPPKQTVTVPLQLVGRAGMTHLRADIFHAGPDEDIGYARMLSVPITVTANAGLQAHHLDISESDTDDVFCASFDLGNAWPKSVAFSCSVLDDDAWKVKKDSTMAPGEVQRVYLDVSRWVRDVKGEQDAEETRQALLRRLRVTWKVDSRQGEVPLHNLVLPAEATNIIRGPAVATKLSLIEPAAASASARSGNFLTVRATVQNRSSRSAPLLLELRPSLAGLSSQSSDDRLRAVAGPLSRFVAALKAGESRDIDFALCPLLTGALAMTATVRSAVSLQKGVKSYPLGESKTLVVKIE
jgi:hypothetical protein